MPAILYRCPVTRLQVQGWIADDADGSVHLIQCHACQRVHLIDPKTEKVVGATDED